MAEITKLDSLRGRGRFGQAANPEEARKARISRFAKMAPSLEAEIKRVLDCDVVVENRPYKVMDVAQSPLIDQFHVRLSNPFVQKYSGKMDYLFSLGAYAATREEAVANLYECITHGLGERDSIRKYKPTSEDIYDEYKFNATTGRLNHMGTLDGFGLPVKSNTP